MSPASSTPINERLDSWKAIANYLGKSVRTAKRWEAEEGLPVHRHMHHRQGTVHAFRTEIDRWLAERGQGPTPPPITQTTDPRPGLMVLPFEHVGPDSGTAWLASGVADALIDRLARTPDLRVMSRTSARIVAGRAEGPTTALRSLVKSHGLSYVVEGTTRADSDDLQVSIRLIDIANDTVVATELFDGKLDQALRIQATIAEHVAAALSKALGQTLTSEGESEDGPASTAEWQALVLARQDALKWRKSGLDAAVDRLKRAIETLGPRPMLLAALGRTWLQYREAGIEPGPGPLRRARTCADELADRDVQHAVRLQLDGWLRYADGNIPGAIRALERADQRQPDDPETIGILANCLLITNQGDRALPLIQRLQMIDPFTPLTACLPGWKLLLDGRFEEAIPYYRRMHELDPDNPMGLAFLTWILVLSGELAQARDLFDTLDPGERDPSTLDPVSRISRFVAAAATDRTDAADWLDESIDALAHASDVFPRLLADGFARLGDTERALHWIDQAIDRGFAHLPYLAERDPMLESLRGLPAFEERLYRLKNLS